MISKATFTCALIVSLIFSIGFLTDSSNGLARSEQAVGAVSPADMQDLQIEMQLLKEKARMMGAELSIDSIQMNIGNKSGDLAATSEGSCTVTITITILGQEAQMSATASTCAEAMQMISAGLDALDP